MFKATFKNAKIINVLQAPINVAVMTVWKDWAPPAERTQLLVFSFYGIIKDLLFFIF